MIRAVYSIAHYVSLEAMKLINSMSDVCGRAGRMCICSWPRDLCQHACWLLADHVYFAIYTLQIYTAMLINPSIN
jgi:hypothetical protein